MYSPNNINDTSDIRNTFSNFHGLNEDNYSNNGGMNENGSDLNSVDSLLMLNNSHQPVFERSHSVQSTSTMFNHQINDSLQYHQQQQQQTQCFMQQQEISYRKIRPEPVNERTIVSSMVGYFHDVIGNGESYGKHSQPSNQRHQHNIVQSGSSTLLAKVATNSPSSASEIKEQIEWLHYENINLLSSTSYTSNSWNIYNNNCGNQTSNKSGAKFQNCTFSSSNILLVLGYKTGFSIWVIDVNGIATEVLSVREPNITHVKLLQLENQKVLIAICKKILTRSEPAQSYKDQDNFTSPSLSHSGSSTDLPQDLNTVNQQQQIPSNPEPQQTQQIAIVNLLNGECLHEILFNGTVLDMKSNADLLCVNSWNRIDAFDLNTFEHRFSLNSCFSQISKSSGKSTNPFTLGSRWLAFADKKFHVILSSQGGVSTDVEQSVAATVINTAKSISKSLVKISETVANVVSKSKNTNSNCSSSDHSPRGHGTKNRHDSKQETDFQPGICTILDTKKYVSNARKSQLLHDENQNWIVAHFFAHQEPIYALEFNPSGRLLVSADCLGQYFNVFQINANSYKCTRTVVKHLYSLYRGDTSSKVRNISFSSDSRWLAIGTKRGTTHIFPLNCYGGVINARTHSKPYLVNRTTKHQRTAGFVESEEGSNPNIALMNNQNLSTTEIQQHQMQQMLQQNYDNSLSSPIVYNNNPKLRNIKEPFIIPAYGQLKQPNSNSTFQSSVISTNFYPSSHIGSGLLTTASNSSGTAVVEATEKSLASGAAAVFNGTVTAISANGPQIAAAAFNSAASMTENMTHLANNTSNLIQYDNVHAIAIFGESRGYLSPEERRDNRLKPVNSLFIISDVNGNLVEYVLDVIIDTNKKVGNKTTNDSPIMLKIMPKAQWSLQRYVASDELRYPISLENPLIFNASLEKKKQRNNSTDSGVGAYHSINGINTYSPTSNNSSLASYQTAPNSIVVQSSNNDEWIKQIDVSTHIGPHRRLFMGPQFVFKTFNSNLTTTKLTSNSSSVISDVETPIIDLSGDIELNTLDLNPKNCVASNGMTARPTGNTCMTQPVQITHSLSKTLKAQQKFDCAPTFIEVGAGSFQEGMPVMCGSQGSRGSQKSLNKDSDLLADSIAESLAEAMNDLNTNHQQNIPFSQRILQQNKTRQMQQMASNGTAAIAINPTNQINSGARSNHNNPLVMNLNHVNQPVIQHQPIPILTPSSVNTNNFTPGSYFMINQSLSGASNIDTHSGNLAMGANGHQMHHTSSASFSSSGSSSSHNSSNMNHEDENSNPSSNSSSIHSSLTMATKRGVDLMEPYSRSDAPSLENIQFQDDINLMH